MKRSAAVMPEQAALPLTALAPDGPAAPPALKGSARSLVRPLPEVWRRLEETLASPAGPLRNKATGLELTHPDTTELMVRLALSDGFAPERVLDPAAGYGNFLYETAFQSPSVRVVVGYEADEQACAVARDRLAPVSEQGATVDMICSDALEAEWHENFDLVVSNPPYVRIHRLAADRERLRLAYRTTVGRFDLYFPFIELATKALRPGGRLVIITSNKFMTTTAGGKLREHITSQYAPLRIIDFRDASPFRAAILASILVMEKGGCLTHHARAIELERCGEASEGSATQRELAETVPPEKVLVTRLGAAPIPASVTSHQITEWHRSPAAWHFVGTDGDFVKAALSDGHETLAAYCPRFSVGIKTTADDVFIAPFDAAGYERGLVEEELLHPLIRGGSVQRWRTSWDPTNGYDRYVLYPHREGPHGRTVAIDLRDLPKAARYLEAHHERLASRDYVIEAGRQWYEIWVPQKLGVLSTHRKVVFPDFAVRNKFALELTGAFVGASAAFGVLRPDLSDDDCWYLLYMLNSPIMEYLHKRNFGTSILSKRYRYWTQHVQKYPMPWPAATLRAQLATEARTAAASGSEPSEHMHRALLAYELDAADAQRVAMQVSKWFEGRVTAS